MTQSNSKKLKAITNIYGFSQFCIGRPLSMGAASYQQSETLRRVDEAFENDELNARDKTGGSAAREIIADDLTLEKSLTRIASASIAARDADAQYHATGTIL